MIAVMLLVACGLLGDAGDALPPAVTPPGSPPAGPVTTPPSEVPESTVGISAIVPTSGDAWGVLGSTPWRPEGDAAQDGVLVRLAQPTYVRELVVEPTGGSLEVTVFADGSQVAAQPVSGPTPIPVGAEVRALFVRIDSASGPAGLQLRLHGADGELRPVLPRIVDAQVSASSTLTPAAAYHSSYLVDQRNDFAWVEGVDGLGVGETVTLHLAESVELSAVEVWPGYQRSEDHFAKNARPAELEIAGQRLTVPDSMGSHTLTLAEPVTVQDVEISITQAHPGSLYADLAISELQLHSTAGPLWLRTSDRAELTAALRAQVAGTSLEPVLDRHYRSLCTDASLKLRSNHSFVRYEVALDSYDDSERTTVFDGSWVPGTASTEWSQVKLYGRRHTISDVFIPYVGRRSDESTRVSGGRVQLAPVAALTDAEVAEVARAIDCPTPPPRASLEANHAIVVSGDAITDILWIQP